MFVFHEKFIKSIEFLKFFSFRVKQKAGSRIRIQFFYRIRICIRMTEILIRKQDRELFINCYSMKLGTIPDG
jgi:hypothetical protein